MTGAPRFDPLPVAEWGDDAVAMLRSYVGERAEQYLTGEPDAVRVPNVLGTLAHHPRLARPWLDFSAHLMRDADLDARLRELMVLRVGWRTRARYEWVQHVRLAPRFGITPAEIETVAGIAPPETAATWTPLEADLLAATDQLLDDSRIDDATWARLAAVLTPQELIEVVFTVGSYACLAMMFKTFDVRLDPEIADLPFPEFPEEGPR